jgi:hypothetical protein
MKLTESKLRKIIKEEIQKLNEANKFSVYVQKYTSSNYDEYDPDRGKTFPKLDYKEFETKPEANKYKRQLLKKYNMNKHYNNGINFKKQLELFTNY